MRSRTRSRSRMRSRILLPRRNRRGGADGEADELGHAASRKQSAADTKRVSEGHSPFLFSVLIPPKFVTLFHEALHDLHLAAGDHVAALRGLVQLHSTRASGIGVVHMGFCCSRSGP